MPLTQAPSSAPQMCCQRCFGHNASTNQKMSPIPVRAWQLEVLCEVFHISLMETRFEKTLTIQNTSCAQAEPKVPHKHTG